jgi:adenylate cyclase
MAVPARSRPFDLDDPEFVRRFTWKIWRRGNVGALVATVTAGVIAALTVPIYGEAVPAGRLLPFLVIFAPPTFVFASAIGAVSVTLFVRRATGWIAPRRRPTGTEITRLATIPRSTAYTVVALWLVGLPTLLFLFTVWAPVRWPAVALQTSVLVLTYCGLQGATLAYLLSEKAVRPVIARVLPSDTKAWPRTLGVTTRLLVAWFVVSGAPLLITAFNIGRLNAAQRALAGPSFVIACSLIVVNGFVVFGIAGQAITAPLERIRAGLKHVAAGDLDAQVVADEAGEIGLLQAGFNQMVEGLREREHMRDVFGRHVGAEVARRAMESEFGVGGERCEATAMFVDIIGSTGLAQRKDPDAVVAILNRFFDAVVRVVAIEGGFVNKFQGDGALCLFGTPIPHDDHAARGLRAACALARELAPLGDIAAAIGVSSGEVVAGNVGAADRYEFTVIGDAVNEAARLTEEAKLHISHVLVSERTVLAAGAEGGGWVSGESIQLRGRVQPTLTYEPASTTS